MDSVATLHNWSNSASTDKGPDHESDTANGDEVRFDGEEVADLVDGKPDGWEGAEPKDEERDPVSCGCRLALKGARVDGVAVPRFPDGADHEVDAVAADVSLNTIPNASLILSGSLLPDDLRRKFATYPLLND
jgi:hypothetical protein